MKRVLVIGGSSTIGRALCRELAAEGARVALTCFRGDPPEGFPVRRVNLREPAALGPALDELVAELDGIDALVHCAVRSSAAEPARFDRLGEVEVAGFNDVLAVNVTSAFFACQHLAPRFDRGGNIVLFGSVDGIKPVPTPVPYAVSKAALHGLTLALAKALGPKNIRINLIAPGILDAGVSRTLPDDLKAEYLRHAGLRRLGSVSEVTGMAAWFALHNTYATGQTILLDGGL